MVVLFFGQKPAGYHYFNERNRVEQIGDLTVRCFDFFLPEADGVTALLPTPHESRPRPPNESGVALAWTLSFALWLLTSAGSLMLPP